MTSCDSKEDDEPENKPDGIALNQRFKDNRNDAVQTFTINASTGGIVTGSQGTKVIIPANAIGQNGTAVTGNIDVELVEIYNKAAMVLQDMSTKGKKQNNDEEALKSAGEFFVNAKQNGTQLEVLLPITIESKELDPTDWEPMQVFRAGDNLEDNDLWQEADEDNDGINDEAKGREGEGGQEGNYVMYSAFDMSEFGWTNLDIWYNFTGQLTDLFVDVPDGYDNDNAAVYLSYDGENGLAKMDIYDTTLEQFTEHFGRIPVGKEVHFIMITEIDGQINYAIQPATIVDDHVEIINSLQPISQTDLTTLINALP
ncbi:MAG: hypothetical protein HF967_10870 [Methanosarcinales archaeon]|nr:hypothetical protein [Methanosarcinales archaeon]